MSMAQLVKGCPLFHEIYDDEVEDIIQNCMVANFERGDHIIEQGGEGTDIYVILAGDAEIIVSKNGHDHKIADVGKGDLFGEMVLINETKRTASIVAKSSCDVLIITYDNFFKYFQKKPKVFALMVLNVTRLVTKRLKNANLALEDLRCELDEHKKNAA